MASPTTPCRMDSTILSVDRKWEGCQFHWTIDFTRTESVNSSHCSHCSDECFPQDVKEVSQNKEVKISSRLGSLRPVLEDGVLRVGGRLQKAVVLSWDEKHPMILPKHHHVRQLIVRHYHEFAAHSCELQRLDHWWKKL